MTKQKLLTCVASVLTTMAESGSGAPESYVMLGLKLDIEEWTTLRSFLLRGGFVTISQNYVELTELGRETARECQAVLQAG